MFEGDSTDMCAGKFPMVSMGGGAEGLACAELEARIPISASGIFFTTLLAANEMLEGGRRCLKNQHCYRIGMSVCVSCLH
jgi:hypothetical protein